MRKLLFVLFFLPIGLWAQSVESFVEYGATVHTGDYTPLWQASNQHGLSSLDNNTYLRGATFYNGSCNKWRFQAGLDLAVAAGFTSTFVVQQAYGDIRYRWLGLFVGSKELDSELLNQALSSGGLTWSGNARPIPEVKIGILDYVHLAPKVQFKAEIAYGKWTDNAYQKEQSGTDNWYAKDILYHHKSFFFRFGTPTSRWQFDMGYRIDAQFGGRTVNHPDYGNKDLGNSLKYFWKVLVPQGGGEDAPEGEQIQYTGNLLGSEHLKLTYKQRDYAISAYLENYFDDFSGMGKLNGFDGLWGIEYKSNHRQAIDGLVLEYYQTTNQSGPLHGVDHSIVEKTGGADNYYNNFLYPAWAHWGMTMANPLVASPIYNKNGYMSFRYNRIKAVHLGWSGNVSEEVDYRAKISYNQTWGTPFEPTVEVLENFSAFAEFNYQPQKLSGWKFGLSVAFDTGDIYGDNLGFQLKIRKQF